MRVVFERLGGIRGVALPISCLGSEAQGFRGTKEILSVRNGKRNKFDGLKETFDCGFTTKVKVTDQMEAFG